MADSMPLAGKSVKLKKQKPPSFSFIRKPGLIRAGEYRLPAKL
jgi:hypothetical protein